MAPNLSRPVSFWLVALLLALFLFAASAPSPLYSVYAALWHFSPVTLTAIYAMYSAGALAALLTTGRLSDHVGRRPIVAFALVVQVAGAVAFIVAENVGALYIGRVLQGIGTGIAIGPLSAWLLDLRPPQDRGFGGLVGAVAPMAGLAAGALVSGALVQYAPEPLRLVFWVLTVAFAAALFAISRVPDPAIRSAGWFGSMRPQVGVPKVARPLFAALAPSVVAMWALAAFYLALGPSLAMTLLGTDNRLVGGSAIAALMGAGAVASAFGRTADPRLVVIRGSIGIITGVAITLIAVAAGSVLGLYAATVIAGVGFGPALGAVFRSLTPLAPPDKRSALFAAIYVLLYFALSVPTVIAGVAVTRYGLHETTYAYGVIVMALAAITAVAISLRSTSPDTASVRRSPSHESGS